jgi:hypothetical protein
VKNLEKIQLPLVRVWDESGNFGLDFTTDAEGNIAIAICNPHLQPTTIVRLVRDYLAFQGIKLSLKQVRMLIMLPDANMGRFRVSKKGKFFAWLNA